MFKSVITITLLSALLLTAAGCSDDEKTTNPPATGGTTSHLDLVDLQAVIEAVAPPEFTAPVGTPTGTDSLEIWTSGDYPLLGKVFGSQDNQSLYRNINDFKDNLEILSEAVLVDENGDIVTGEFSDSVWVTDKGGSGDSMLIHYTATVTALTEPVAIPTQSQAVIGETVDVDYLITVAVSGEMGEMNQHYGLTANDSVQTLLQYNLRTGDVDQDESSLVYASLLLADSTFTFRGVGRVAYVDGELFTFGYNMTSESSSQFAYRMSWFSNELPDEQTLLGCIVGGGNKDVEFAMKYRQFMPADTTEMDPWSSYDQVFGPNYSEGTGLISDYEEYLSDELIYTYDAIPMEQIVSPWVE